MDVALTDERGGILGQASQALPPGKEFDEVTQLIISLAQRVVSDAGCALCDVAGVGVGAPGVLDCDRGVVIKAANFDWCDAPLAATIERGLGVPAFLENDANCAVLAEWWTGAGAGSGVKHLVMFTLGTGVGGGIVSDNRLIRGASGMAGELGHTIVDVGDSRLRLCENTGVYGVLERFASAKAVAERAKEELARKRQTSTLAALSDVTCQDVFDHARAGDALASQLVDQTADALALSFINTCRCVDPQLIVVTGGMARAGETLFRPLREHFARRWWKIQPLSTCRIVPASAGVHAGVLGAAACAKQRQGLVL